EQAVDYEARVDVVRVLRDRRTNLLHYLLGGNAHVEHRGPHRENLKNSAVHEQHHGAGPADPVVGARPGDDGARDGVAHDVEVRIGKAGHVYRAGKVLRRVTMTHRAVLRDHSAGARFERRNAEEELLAGCPEAFDADDGDGVDAGRRIRHKDHNRRGTGAGIYVAVRSLDPERHGAAGIAERRLHDSAAREAVRVLLLL